MADALADALRAAPVLARPALARERLGDLRAAAGAAHPVRPFLDRPAVAALLEGLADHSPYLWRLVGADPGRLAAMLGRPPEETLAGVLARLAHDGDTQADVMRGLRAGKAEIALLVALADIGGVWRLEQVTAALTAFADASVRAALRFLLRDAHARGRLVLPDPEDPEPGCGLVVLALGKQGAGELNYSSDIDIVVYFDPATAAVPAGTPQAPLYVKLTQTLGRMLSERTAEGYVQRVDLRLRPDPGSTAVAIGLPSALAYYEQVGQNWERAALIKARPVAGDLPLGATFLRDLDPFIWRKYFDYAAIADVHAMKRQIHAVRGHSAVAVAGHDVKLGRGGIREIEFFVQTQQLIFGGRRPHLRGAQTLSMLEALRQDGWIDDVAVAEMSAAYRFLRTIEHRLQMVADEQTQRLPLDPAVLDAFARFAGYPTGNAFATAFTAYARTVERHYARLFEHAPALDAEGGSLVFTGVEDDPETIATLAGLGFVRPRDVAELVRGWHFGRRAAVRSPRAREVLTDLVPRLLTTFARSSDPDAALGAFDAMLGRMPAAVELLSMLRANQALLNLFGDILGLAPRLAETVAMRPHVLDAAIDPANLAALDAAGRMPRITRMLDPGLAPEAFLDRARDLAGEELFLIGVRLLSGSDAPDRAGEAYADLACAVVLAMLAHVRATFEAAHGPMPGGGCVVLAMGKLGSREMTAGSDLDLILVYDDDPDRPLSTGDRPLDAARYYTRLTQRLIAALTVPTRRGRLYAVDMRLRPSGGQGPLASRLRSFMRYQAEEAATWEHMALTRARVIAGDADLTARVEAAIAALLQRRRNPAAVRRDVAAMRGLIARQKGEADVWDFKLLAGGLLDIEFIAQALILQHAADHPTLLSPATVPVLREAAARGLMDDATARALIAAHELYTGLLQITRLTTTGRFDPASAGVGLRRRVALAADLPDFDRLEGYVRDTAGAVRATFMVLIGDPRAATPPPP